MTMQSNRKYSSAGVAVAIFLSLWNWSATLHAQTGPKTDLPGPSGEYQRLMSDGALQNSLGQSLAAERAFARALKMCLTRKSVTPVSCLDPMLRLGLELSNQSRFDAADKLFQQANRLAVASASPLHVSRYLTYRAMDMANRAQFKQALRLVHMANDRYKALIDKQLAASRAGTGRDMKQRLNPILFELAHGLFVQASIDNRLGNPDTARKTMALANEIVERVEGFPSEWRVRLENALQPLPSQAQQTETVTDEDVSQGLE